VGLVAVVALAASGMLGGGGLAASSAPASVAIASLAPSVGPSVAPSASAALPSATVTPPTPSPAPTPTPAGRQVRITGITVNGGDYVVDYQVFGYAPALPGPHVHFFFDTVSVADAGVPGRGPWFLYAGPVPFTGYAVSERPTGANRMCVLVANANHSIIRDTGNCVDLP
jgi:hypothetical protein